jgi:hypothetical protein
MSEPVKIDEKESKLVALKTMFQNITGAIEDATIGLAIRKDRYEEMNAKEQFSDEGKLLKSEINRIEKDLDKHENTKAHIVARIEAVDPSVLI